MINLFLLTFILSKTSINSSNCCNCCKQCCCCCNNHKLPSNKNNNNNNNNKININNPLKTAKLFVPENSTKANDTPEPIIRRKTQSNNNKTEPIIREKTQSNNNKIEPIIRKKTTPDNNETNQFEKNYIRNYLKNVVKTDGDQRFVERLVFKMTHPMKNVIKESSLKCENYSYEYLNSDFNTQNYAFTNELNTCWFTSSLIAAFNTPAFQKSLKEFKNPDSENTNYIKIMQELFNDMQNNYKNYKTDFSKYYKKFEEDGKKNHPDIFHEPDPGCTKISNDPHQTLDHYILKDINHLKLMFEQPTLQGNGRYKIISDDLYLEIHKTFYKFSPVFFILDKVLDNAASKYVEKKLKLGTTFKQENEMKWRDVIIPTNPLFSSILYKVNDEGEPIEILGSVLRYAYIFGDKKILTEIARANGLFQQNMLDYLNSDKQKNINDIKPLCNEIVNILEKYRFELNSIMLGPGHIITIVKDKNGKFFNLQSTKEKTDPNNFRELNEFKLDENWFAFYNHPVKTKTNTNHYYSPIAFFISVYEK